MLNEKISVLIIDKDKTSVSAIADVLAKFSELDVVGKATSAKQGMNLGNQLVPQLLVINVDLPDTNGLKFVKELQNKGINVEVVFVSENERMAYSAMELEPLDYMILPFEKETVEKMILRFKYKMKRNELYRKMNEFIRSQESSESRVFFQKKGIIVLHPEEIIFGKAQLTSSLLKLVHGEDVLLKTKFGDTLEILNSPEILRIGRSYFINRNYLWKIDKKKLRCIMYYEGKTWEVPASKAAISSLEKLNAQPIY